MTNKSPKPELPRQLTENDIDQTLKKLIEVAFESSQADINTANENHETPGIQLHVEAPEMGISWSGSAGYTDLNHSEVITAQYPVRIASTTKTFVAAAILRLWEQQRLDLDIDCSQYLSDAHCAIINTKGYSLNEITVRHLLTHTSGLFDYADSKPFAKAIGDNPQYHWTRTEQLQLAMQSGNPYGAPGEVYRYSDTGYILLGEIIERVYGQSLGVALRELLNYQGLGLTSTWLEVMESPPKDLPPRVHQYMGKDDSYNIHASFDIYGGGGLVSTVTDMSVFMRALFTGSVYSDSETLTEMLTTVQAKQGGPDAYGSAQQMPGTYCLGIDGGESGVVYSHAGFFGTYAAYAPSRDLAFSFSLNQHYASNTLKKMLVGILALFEVVL